MTDKKEPLKEGDLVWIDAMDCVYFVRFCFGCKQPRFVLWSEKYVRDDSTLRVCAVCSTNAEKK